VVKTVDAEVVERGPGGHAINRFEVKYFVATRQVPALVSELEPFSTADPHSDGPDGYSVFSVYWDTPQLAFFWEKVEGVKHRRKLRFRRYGSSDTISVEIKQREDRTLHKRRLAWPLTRVQDAFGDGGRSIGWDAVNGDPVATEAALMIERLRLQPTIGVRYQRRARFGAFDPGLRLTFDSRLMYRPAPVSLAQPFTLGSYIVDPRVSVLEIKYDHRAPRWLTKLVCRYGLKVVRMSKYCSAVDRDRSGGQNS
jgi:hypothetical protein